MNRGRRRGLGSGWLGRARRRVMWRRAMRLGDKGQNVEVCGPPCELGLVVYNAEKRSIFRNCFARGLIVKIVSKKGQIKKKTTRRAAWWWRGSKEEKVKLGSFFQRWMIYFVSKGPHPSDCNQHFRSSRPSTLFSVFRLRFISSFTFLFISVGWEMLRSRVLLPFLPNCGSMCHYFHDFLNIYISLPFSYNNNKNK